MKASVRIAMFLSVVIAILATPALADPWPGEWPKFAQKPMIETKINDKVYFGHDEVSTAWWRTLGMYDGEYMADDFADKVDNDVVHVTWWGSYMNPAGVQGKVRRFLIAFETDVPAVYDDAGNILEPSHPGRVLQSQIVTLNTMVPPMPGTFTEVPETYTIPTPPPEPVYKYNAELARPFDQEANKVYWLKIVALVDPDQENLLWGWHNRDYTIKDPLASQLVRPGEHVDGQIPNPTGTDPTLIYHFQDDAVTGRVTIYLPETQPTIEVIQQTYRETYYVNDIDGPGPMPGTPFDFPGIGQYSKDLAFVLHAVPEPSSLVLVALGLACLAGLRRPR
jgi:hypothetical protein